MSMYCCNVYFFKLYKQTSKELAATGQDALLLEAL